MNLRLETIFFYNLQKLFIVNSIMDIFRVIIYSFESLSVLETKLTVIKTFDIHLCYDLYSFNTHLI